MKTSYLGYNDVHPHPYRRSVSESANQSSFSRISSAVDVLIIVDLLWVSIMQAISYQLPNNEHPDSQLSYASTPFSRPIPLSFIPPLHHKKRSGHVTESRHEELTTANWDHFGDVHLPTPALLRSRQTLLQLCPHRSSRSQLRVHTCRHSRGARRQSRRR